jgi:hypothetical protein
MKTHTTCGKCGKLMNITENQNYGENGGEHVTCPMSWQEKENERYLEMLRERWTVEGERIPIRLGGDPEHGINSVGEYQRTPRCSTIYHINGRSHRCILANGHEWVHQYDRIAIQFKDQQD